MSTSASSPLCSVIIPCHNYAHLLPRAIDSALGQAGVPFEVIVVDDASTDETAAVAAEYGEAVRYQLQPRGGPGVACRNGWFAARGRYVMFLDADDALQPGYLAAMTAALEREQSGVAFPAIVNVASDGRAKPSPPLRLHRNPRDNLAAFAQGLLRPSAGGCMLERSVLTPFQPLPIRAFQTHGFDRVVIGYLLATQRAVAAPDAVIELHDHPQRLRYDVAAAQHSGLDVVKVLFDSNILPDWAATYRGAFEARLLLEHAAMAQRRGDHRSARGLYLAAMRANPQHRRRWRVLRRLLVSSVRAMFQPVCTARERAQADPASAR